MPASAHDVGRGYLLLALAAAAGTLANPNGWRLHQHIFSYLSNSALLDRVAEFQSFKFHSDGAFQVMLAIFICFAGGFAALAAANRSAFCYRCFLMAAALRSARALPIAALLLTPAGKRIDYGGSVRITAKP